MLVSRLEKNIGIEVYAISSLGVGGVIRQSCQDFLVEEILINGSKAEVHASPEKTEMKAKKLQAQRYLLCLMVKRNWDTFQAIGAIAEQLGINPNQIHIAGIKDAKAITAQYITIEGVKSEDIERVHIKNMKVLPLGYFRSKLSPYYLYGNAFKIVIRAISHAKAVIQQRLEKTVKEIESLGGVPNFFGHQRFGTTRPITHLVGKALIKGDFQKAAMIYLAKPCPYEREESRRIREELYHTQDFKKALKVFPKHLHFEHLMLKHLAKKPDFVGAFRMLPKRLRLLFPQAYQAYLFNKFLSKRIALQLPLNKAEIGDYVVKIEPYGLPSSRLYNVASREKLTEINNAIASGRMCLAIPLVGFRQQLSKDVQGEIERQILEEEGVTLENFKIEKMPEISLKGGLRTVLTPLKDFKIEEISRDAVNPS
ncbi:MAG: tRNA pseudouridine(13) synthase TruD, partial [Candidatus Bathyarchaeia archaeon]